jgi:hypothetical protein
MSTQEVLATAPHPSTDDCIHAIYISACTLIASKGVKEQFVVDSAAPLCTGRCIVVQQDFTLKERVQGGSGRMSFGNFNPAVDQVNAVAAASVKDADIAAADRADFSATEMAAALGKVKHMSVAGRCGVSTGVKRGREDRRGEGCRPVVASMREHAVEAQRHQKVTQGKGTSCEVAVDKKNMLDRM